MHFHQILVLNCVLYYSENKSYVNFHFYSDGAFSNSPGLYRFLSVIIIIILSTVPSARDV